MNQGDRFADRFTVLAPAGIGGTARVFKAFDDESQSIVALKVFSDAGKDPAVVNEIWNRELQSLQRLDHPAIVRFITAGRAATNSDRYIALEWIDGQTLEKFLESRGKLTWDNFERTVGIVLLEALSHAAERNVSHRDLTPANIMLDAQERIRIIDFGQAKLREAIPIGLTLQDWKTEPYCLPENDNGTYTLTRDPYAFCAIAIRALSGQRIDSHEELYRRLREVDLPEKIRPIMEKALEREPALRFPTVVEFRDALHCNERADEHRKINVIPIRLVPGLGERLAGRSEVGETPEEAILGALNDVVAVSPNPDPGGGPLRIQLDTEQFRIIADVDATSADHLVIVSATPRKFRLDAIFRTDRWIPSCQFSLSLPKSALAKTIASDAIRSLYEGLEDFIASNSSRKKSDGAEVIEDWRNLLEALRFLARTSVPPLRYSKVEQDGQRLIVTVENAEDAQEEQLRTISEDGSWVFRGEVESVKGSQCVLISPRRFNLDRIPASGTLDIDWQQTRIALQRQAKAVDRVERNETPNAVIKQLLLGADLGKAEPAYVQVPGFFDKSLDDAKKAVVARWAAGVDLLVTHGPPGTGKTKLIVELIRQALRANPDCRILLASQTHVALDNALHRLLDADPNVSCVRIGSGTKEADPRVGATSLEHRSELLRASVAESAHSFIADIAQGRGVDVAEVELGIRALDLLGILKKRQEVGSDLEELNKQLEDIKASESGETGLSSNQRSENSIRAGVVVEELEEKEDAVRQIDAERGAARQRLASLGKDGKAISSLDLSELEEWCDVLLEGKESRIIADLIKLAEEWRLRFAQSVDFNEVIVNTSSIVAGTCVGFCREEAASKATFDLCIIDEAGKATTTELLVPIVQSRAIVLLGDHHQLPAVLDNAIKRRELQLRYNLRPELISEQLFEKLSRDLRDGNQAKLTIQYRMRGEIGRLISECFYQGQLEPAEVLSSRSFVDLTSAGIKQEVTWIDPYSGAKTDSREQKVGTSYRNVTEADCIIALLESLRKALSDISRESWPSIAVISGYAPQVAYIKNQIRRNSALDALEVECASVHSFQGREVDVCIYSLTRNNNERSIGMLKDWRHLNVALSRAKNYLVVVGGEEFCRSIEGDNPFDRILNFIGESSVCGIEEWSDD